MSGPRQATRAATEFAYYTLALSSAQFNGVLSGLNRVQLRETLRWLTDPLLPAARGSEPEWLVAGCCFDGIYFGFVDSPSLSGFRLDMIRSICCFATLLVVLCFTNSLSAAEKTASPFNGKTLEGWAFKKPEERSKWKVGVATLNADKSAELVVSTADENTAELVNAQGGGVDIYTVEKYGSCTIDLEFMVPKGSNSGVYVMGEYEVQIFDSYGKETIGAGDLGSIYSASVARVNAAKKPGEWQRLVIEFESPKFEGEKKTADARFVKVTLNDQVIHENITIKGPTPSGVSGKEAPTGPLMLQGDHGPVAYRKIKVLTR